MIAVADTRNKDPIAWEGGLVVWAIRVNYKNKEILLGISMIVKYYTVPISRVSLGLSSL